MGWPLYKRFGHAYAAFKLAVTDPEKVFEGLEMSDEIRSELLKDIQRRLTPQAVKIRADIELTCFKYQGSVHRHCILSTPLKLLLLW